MTANETLPLSRSKALKALTHDTHELLDQRIMAYQPFANQQNYARYLQAQFLFLRDMEALYDNPHLAAILSDLDERRRYDRIATDLADLGQPLPDLCEARRDGASFDLPTALGWLYVVEGSKLGAAILLKMTEKLGLSPENGARHLAAHPDGRARHWREFVAILDGQTFNDEEEARVVAGGKAGFALMNQHLDKVYG